MQNQKSISKQNNEYIKKIHKIDFFQSIVAFHVSEKKAENSDSIINKGKLVNAEDYRNRDVYLLSKVDRFKKQVKGTGGS